MNKDINAKQRLLDVFDLLVQLISQRTSVLGNVHIGGSTLPNLWQELLHAALVDGIDTNNARVVLRGILAHFGEWLEETFTYFQVAEQRGKCASLIEVDYDSVPAPLIHFLHFGFSQEMLLALDPQPPPGSKTASLSGDSSDDDDESPPRPPPPPQGLDEWKVTKRVPGPEPDGHWHSHQGTIEPYIHSAILVEHRILESFRMHQRQQHKHAPDTHALPLGGRAQKLRTHARSLARTHKHSPALTHVLTHARSPPTTTSVHHLGGH
jgi:hypothetical protein